MFFTCTKRRLQRKKRKEKEKERKGKMISKRQFMVETLVHVFFFIIKQEDNHCRLKWQTHVVQGSQTRTRCFDAAVDQKNTKLRYESFYDKEGIKCPFSWQNCPW